MSIHLPPVLMRDAILGSDSAGPVRHFAAAHGIVHEALKRRAGIRTPRAFHLQNINNHHSGLKGWPARFIGAASDYLPHYLGERHTVAGERIATPAEQIGAALGVPQPEGQPCCRTVDPGNGTSHIFR